jgi:septum formation protein
MREIILASASPRRAELLRRLGVVFTSVPSLVEEEPRPEGARGADPRQLALKRAGDKATAVSGRFPQSLVLAADTVVWCDGRIMDKPKTAAAAREMLQFLSGRQHQVYTGLALRLAEKTADAGWQGGYPARLDDVVETSVQFRKLSDAEIEGYLATGEPLGKAGGYGIQGFGALLIARIEGCFYNVVGLPLARLGEMLSEFGVDLLCPGRSIT